MNARLQVAFYTLAFGAAATTAAQAALPARPAPAGVHSIDDASGGRIIVGGVGPVTGPGDAFRAGLRRVRGYFSSMQLESVVRSKDGTLTIGLFRARLGAQDVSGLALSAYRPGPRRSPCCSTFVVACGNRCRNSSRICRAYGQRRKYRIHPHEPAGTSRRSRRECTPFGPSR
jgi:hypothetical protein